MLFANAETGWAQWGIAGALVGVLVLFLRHLVTELIPRMEERCAANLKLIADQFSGEMRDSRETFRLQVSEERRLFREDSQAEKADRDRAVELIVREIQACKEEARQAKHVASSIRDMGCRTRNGDAAVAT